MPPIRVSPGRARPVLQLRACDLLAEEELPPVLGAEVQLAEHELSRTLDELRASTEHWARASVAGGHTTLSVADLVARDMAVPETEYADTMAIIYSQTAHVARPPSSPVKILLQRPRHVPWTWAPSPPLLLVTLAPPPMGASRSRPGGPSYAFPTPDAVRARVVAELLQDIYTCIEGAGECEPPVYLSCHNVCHLPGQAISHLTLCALRDAMPPGYEVTPCDTPPHLVVDPCDPEDTVVLHHQFHNKGPWLKIEW